MNKILSKVIDAIEPPGDMLDSFTKSTFTFCTFGYQLCLDLRQPVNLATSEARMGNKSTANLPPAIT